MAEWSILATGPSMSQLIADSLVGNKAIVVSDAFRLAPWADALVSQDRKWWDANPDAHEFVGPKYTTGIVEGVLKMDCRQWHSLLGTHTNSGLAACCLAQSFGATRIKLYGFDMHGSHFFGEHKAPLMNTTPERFRAMIQQFKDWNHQGIQVINMTPGSALDWFEKGY